MLTVQEMFDLSHTRAAKLLESVTYAWEALGSIGETIRQLGPTLDPEKYDHPQEDCADGIHYWPLHHWREHGSTPMRVHSRQCAGRRRLCCGQLHGIEKCDSLR